MSYGDSPEMLDYIDHLEAENERLRDENAKLRVQLTWKPVSEKPEKDQIVLATYLGQYGKRRCVRAVYIRQYEEEAGDDDELCVEYCHEKDEWYLKEGWYELIDNWDYSSAAIVEGVVDYWMPMPPAPDTQLRQLAEDGGNLESELLKAHEHMDNLEFLLKQKNETISQLEAKAATYDRLMSGGKKTLKEIANFLGNPVAVDREGRLLWSPKKPEIGLFTWIWYDKYLPKNLIDYSGDWKDSLTMPDGWED